MTSPVTSSSSSPIGSVQGLASGIQWRDMIDQIMAAAQASTLDPVTAKQTADKARLAAWQSYNDVVGKLRDAASALQDPKTFGAFQASAGTSATTGKSVVSATAAAGAIAGNYQVEVDSLAQAEKLGGTPVADVTAALGFSGDVFIGGQKMSVVAGDSLNAVRDKINALNSGPNASHVSASILSVSSGVNRLVLGSDNAGSAGIELVENGGSSVLSSLGLVSAALTANTIGGNARSYGFGTSTTALGQALGATMPAAGSFKVNGTRVDIDLSQDSLSAIAGKINAATGANTASVSTEVVNGQTVSRLIVTGTVTTNPDDGAPAEAISTQNLQQLGFLENVRGPGMQLIPPADATLKIDGVPVTRSTNVISDAIAGVTLTLQQSEVGTAVNVSVTRDPSTAVTALQSYAAAYNGVVNFVTTNTAAGGPLPFDSAIRATMSQIKGAVLNTVTGLTNASYTSAPTVGVALDKTGLLQVDTAKLTAALAASPDEVQALFATGGSSTLSTIQYMGATGLTQPGTYAVSVTQAATTPSATSTALVGAYGNAAVANIMNVTDSFTGKTSTISLTNADTMASIAAKLNVAFGNDGQRVTASVIGGSQLQINGLQYGSAANFTVGFMLDAAMAAQQFGFAGTPYAGIDVAGTINGKAATGAGRLLTANAPAVGDTNDAQGLSVLYTGTTPPESSNVSYVLGTGGMMYAASNSLVETGDGQIQTAENNIQTQIDAETKRATDIQTRLDAQRKTLTASFTAMETAMSKLQSQGAALTSQLNALQQPTK